MRINLKSVFLCIVFVSICLQSYPQIVLKIIPPELENVIYHGDCEFQIINKQDNSMNIYLQLKIDYDTNSCIFTQESYLLKLKGNDSFRANWDTICKCKEPVQIRKKSLGKGVYNISLVATKEGSLKIIGSDCLQIFNTD